MHVLALDVGTSSVKAAVLDTAGAAPAGPVAKHHCDLDFPTPDAAEIDPDKLWAALADAARRAAAGPKPEAVGLSCLTPALVLLDAEERPLGPFWAHLDRRARPVARQVQQEVGDEFLRSTGNRPLPGGISAVCFKQRCADEPALAGKVRRYLHLSGWLGLMLTGEAAFDPGNACFTGLYDAFAPQPDWSPRWCDYFGVDRAWLPPVYDGRETLGQLRPEVAADWGVPAGLPVAVGVPDTSSAMLAAQMGPGDLLHNVGTTQVLAVLTDRPQPSPRRLTRRLGTGPGFVTVTHNPVGGSALDWIYHLCFRDEPEAEFFAHTVPEALERKPTVTLEPPFLGGDRLEIEERDAALHGLTVATDRLDLLAAVLHAMREGHRQAYAALGTAGPPRRVFLTGGAAGVVRQLLPEYADLDVRPLDEGAMRGVARLFSD